MSETKLAGKGGTTGVADGGEGGEHVASLFGGHVGEGGVCLQIVIGGIHTCLPRYRRGVAT
jgi:hypothetical protein